MDTLQVQLTVQINPLTKQSKAVIVGRHITITMQNNKPVNVERQITTQSCHGILMDYLKAHILGMTVVEENVEAEQSNNGEENETNENTESTESPAGLIIVSS